MSEERFVPYPDTLLDRDDLPRHAQDTLIRILRLCWKSDHYDWSNPLTMKQMAVEFNIERRTLDRHIRSLTSVNILRIDKLGYSVFRIGLSANYTEVGHEKQGLDMSAPSFVLTSINSKDSIKEEDSLKEEVGHESPTSAELGEMIEFLSDKGISHPALSEIPSMGITLDYIKGWFNYADLKDWGENRNGRVINKIRSGNPVPDICVICYGTDGDHKGVVDEDSHYSMCPLEGRPDLTAQEAFEIYGEVNPV